MDKINEYRFENQSNDVDFYISKEEIKAVKHQLMLSGLEGYKIMLQQMSTPSAAMFTDVVPGTIGLKKILNALIILARCNPLILIGLIVFGKWIWAIAWFLIWLYGISKIQTNLNYEVGARYYAMLAKIQKMRDVAPSEKKSEV